MAILIDNRQTRHPVRIRELKRKIQAILDAMESPEAELSVALVNDRRIAELNESYLQHSGPTNVISFPMREGEFNHINPHLLGDVVISADTCAVEAQAGGLTFTQRLDQLMVHGLLHLFGYDHIHNKEEARLMERKSAEMLALLDALAIAPPHSRKPATPKRADRPKR